ncbi:MAG TPA: hypothetical protein ENI37_02955 [Chloroflexi bacterium]|nr:hypothetical protein [Chloroflexota bacterium]
MAVEIRPIQTNDEYRAVERLQRQAWALEDVEIVPHHLLLTVQKNGGLVLGAFESLPEEEGERLVGFVFGFVGLLPGGKVKHCSHMAGVAPACQNRNIGYRLKLAQRQRVLAQGIDLITWTFDPLESRNARLNFHKLGAICNIYLRNLYGDMRDGLNVGLPSDRFQVDWLIASDHVASRLRDGWVGLSLSALQADGVPILNRPLPGGHSAPRLPSGEAGSEQALLRPPETVLPLEGDRLLVQIPAHFQAVKSADLGLARAWREHSRALFEAAFAKGYTVTDLLFEHDRSCYLLQKDWRPR